MPEGGEDWATLCDRLLADDRVAFATFNRLVSGFLGQLRAYDFREEWDDLRQDRANFGNLVQLHVEAARAEVERACRGRLKELTEDAKDEILKLAERVAKRNAHLHIKDLGQLVQA